MIYLYIYYLVYVSQVTHADHKLKHLPEQLGPQLIYGNTHPPQDNEDGGEYEQRMEQPVHMCSTNGA